jgi:class 3 adenylate cyclase
MMKSDPKSRLIEAERAGLKLAVICRTAALSFLLVWMWSVSPSILTTLIGTSILSVFLIGGGLYYHLMNAGHDKGWMKYVMYAADYITLGLVYAHVPVSVATPDTPAIFAMRSFGAYSLFLPIAMATLSLNPRLVLWCGAASFATWMGLAEYSASQIENPLEWSDLPVGPTLDEWIALYFNPDFVGVGGRAGEATFILISAIVIALAVHRARHVFLAQVQAEEERGFIADRFGEYVPRQLAEKMLEDPAALAPQSRRATVMSVDIAGFTSLCQKSEPAEIFALLDSYFTDGADIVASHGGVIVDFSGDGFLAAFNAPLELAQHEAAGVACARQLLTSAATKDHAGHRLKIRIGMATGDIAAGSVGGGGRRAYTVHGDPVNLAARLQEIAKHKGVTVAMDGETADGSNAPDLPVLSEAEDIRGRSTTVRVVGL